MQPCFERAQSLDRRDFLAGGGLHRRHAGAYRRAVEMDRAGTALRDTTAELGALQAGLFADYPQQRRLRIDVEPAIATIDAEIDHPFIPWGNSSLDSTRYSSKVQAATAMVFRLKCGLDCLRNAPLLSNTARNARGLLTFIACAINTVVCFTPLFLLAILKLVVPLGGFRWLVTNWLMKIGEAWVGFNSLIFSLVNDTRWEVHGIEGLKRDSWYLLLANHSTWVDIVVMQTVFNRRIPFLKFFIKQELIWFPFLGIAWWALDMPFMKRYSKSYLARHPEKKGKDFEATRRACEKFRATPTSVINFVEGTRFTEAKKKKRKNPDKSARGSK